MHYQRKRHEPAERIGMLKALAAKLPRYDRQRGDGVLEAERHFRKTAGYRAIPQLVATLRAHDAAIDRHGRVDNRKQAA